jgi:hypothetical protein
MKTKNKRDSLKRQLRLVTLAAKRRLRWRKYKRQYNIERYASLTNQIYRGSGDSKPRIRIQAPKEFSLTYGRASLVVDFIAQVSYQVLEVGNRVTLDFSKTAKLLVPGAILLFAELSRIAKLSKLGHTFRIKSPTLKKPRQVLKQIGIYEIAGTKLDETPSFSDVVYWRATSGANQNRESALGELVEHITDQIINPTHLTLISKKDLWSGVSEAVTNSVMHAYKHPRASDQFAGLEDTKWWMFTQIKDNRLTVAVCDLGCGYRKTLDASITEWFSQKISGLTGGNADAMAIEAAMEYGRSSDKLPERGRGSKCALDVLNRSEAGTLRILSNTGCVDYVRKNGETRLHKSQGIDTNINATIVWWHLPLREANHVNN